MRQPKNIIVMLISCVGLSILAAGCGQGYSNSWPYPEEIKTVYVEMFDSKSFRRDHEYDLTDAICKRIESQTPYKIVSDRDIADSVLSGQIEKINTGGLTMERKTGMPLEQETRMVVTMNWKNLQNGEMIVENQRIFSSATFSKFVGQDYEYAADVAVNRAAQRVVERMQIKF